MLPVDIFQGPEHASFHFGGGQSAVLLIHGFPGSPAEVRPLGEYLASTGWTTHGLMLPGLGQDIGNIANTTNQDWVSAVQHFIDEMIAGYQEVWVLGYSLGGAIALQAVRGKPIDGLVLIAPFWKLDSVTWKLLPVMKIIFPTFKPLQQLQIDLDDPEVHNEIEAWLPEVDLDDPGVRKEFLNFEVPTELINQLRIAGSAGGKAIRSLNLPLLVIQGINDQMVKPNLTRELIQGFAGKLRYIEVEGEHDLVRPQRAPWPQVPRLISQFLHDTDAGSHVQNDDQV